MYLVVFLLFSSALQCVICDNSTDNTVLNFTQLAVKYGQQCEEFDITTKDGYILKLFHIIGNKSQPIVLVHGNSDSADTFIIRGESSLAITLANKGCDVWVMNVRGNQYSRRHVTLNPDKDAEFWNYTFHEMGVIDLATNIDFVLNKTNQSQLTIIAHSQGTTMSFVLTSVLTEYNAKIKSIIAMAPIAFLNNLKFPMSTLLTLWPITNLALKATGQEEIDKSTPVSYLSKMACSQGDIGYELCAKTVMFSLFHQDPDEIEAEFYRTMLKHYPSSTSRKDFEHYSQININKRFTQFDHGDGNLKVYGSKVPIDYPVSNITTHVSLLVGPSDPLAVAEDVKTFENLKR